MHLIDIINQYKLDFINIGTNIAQKEFLHISFIKWYMLCKKAGVDEIFPMENIFMSTYSVDLIYANKTKNTNFDIFYVSKKTKDLFNKYYELYANIIFGENEEDIYGNVNGDGSWTQINKSINRSQYNRLKSLYFSIKGNDKTKFTQTYEKLLRLYQFIEMDTTTHLSLPPIFVGIELFGSCINTHNTEYCSLFKIEKLFCSLGSFWDYTFHKSEVYLCNPPFDVNLIKNMAEYLLQNLKTTKYEVIVIITLPIWDSDTQRMIGAKDFKMKFEGYELLINSKFMREKIVLDKSIYKYWDYSKERSIAVSHTHLIILSNINYIEYKKVFNLEKLINAWRNFSINF